MPFRLRGVDYRPAARSMKGPAGSRKRLKLDALRRLQTKQNQPSAEIGAQRRAASMATFNDWSRPVTRFALPLVLLLALPPVHAQTDSAPEPAIDLECSRLRAEIAGAENAKRAALQKQQTAWKAVIPFAVIGQHASATSKVADADKRLNDLNVELTRRGCPARNAT